MVVVAKLMAVMSTGALNCGEISAFCIRVKADLFVLRPQVSPRHCHRPSARVILSSQEGKKTHFCVRVISLKCGFWVRSG